MQLDWKKKIRLYFPFEYNSLNVNIVFLHENVQQDIEIFWNDNSLYHGIGEINL